MKHTCPHVPDDCKVIGSIIESDNPDDLGQDMLEVRLPNGDLVTAGWLDGKYVVEATCGLEQLVPAETTEDPRKAIEIVKRLIGRLHPP